MRGAHAEHGCLEAKGGGVGCVTLLLANAAAALVETPCIVSIALTDPPPPPPQRSGPHTRQSRRYNAVVRYNTLMAAIVDPIHSRHREVNGGHAGGHAIMGHDT